MKGAGTDAKVFLQMYGENSKTDLIYLRKKADNFKKAAVDKFKVDSTHFIILHDEIFNFC